MLSLSLRQTTVAIHLCTVVEIRMILIIIWEDRLVKKLCNFSLLFCLFLSASLFVGCEKDSVADGEFTATMESSDGKSYIAGISGNRHNCWETTDIIYVNAQPVKEFRLDMEEWKAIFKPAEHADSYRMFTYGGEAFTWSGNVVNFSLSETYDGQDMPMWATAGDFGPVVFHNLFSVIHFTGLDAYATGTPITVTTQNTNISGSFSYNFATGSLTRGTGSKQRVITVSGSEAWMVIPTIPNETFTVRIGAVGSTNSDLQFKTRSIPANMVLNCAAFSNHNYTLVHNATELANALESNTTKIRLANSIDFSGKGYYDDLFYNRYGNDFDLDGNGFTITIDRPIFSILHTKVKVSNLTLAGQFRRASLSDWEPAGYSYGFANNYDLISQWGTSGSVTAVDCVSSVKYSSGTPGVPFTR